jgi:hypothetical protein
MFGYSYRYWPGGDGRRYCFTTSPVFVCTANQAIDDDELLDRLAGELGVRPKWLAGKLRHMSDRKRDETTGRLTNTCANCGAPLKRLGFRRWIEAEGSEDDPSIRVNKRLGGDGFVLVEGPWYSPTQRDAREWAGGRAKATQ